ncbi:MAG: two-component system histidine kinase PnpS [Halanaerobiales bacterium]
MLKWSRLNLRQQFLILFIAIQIVALGALFLYFTLSHRNFYLEQLEENMLAESRLIVDNQKIQFDRNSRDEVDNWAVEMGEKIGARITIIHRNGTVIADSSYNPQDMDNHAGRPEVKEVLMAGEPGISSRYSDTLKKEMYYLAYPYRKNGEIAGVVRVARSLAAIKGTIYRNAINFLLFLVAILLISLLVLWKFSADIINPLSRITEMAGDIARGHLEKRIEVKDYDNEIGTMARMFNYMAARLEKKIKQISEEKNRMEAILASMVDGVIAVDSKNEVILMNLAARKLFSIGNRDVAGRTFLEVARYQEIESLLETTINDGKERTEEFTINTPEEKILRCHFAPISGDRGQIKGAVVVLTDITEIRKLEKVRKDFVGNVSHELRTPLTSIIGYVDTILENRIDEPGLLERFLGIIKDEADRLSLLIKDLLNLSEIENKEHKLQRAELQPVINRVIKVLKEKAEGNNITITVEIERELPPVLMVPHQIEQVIFNLVDNSIKYNEAGGNVKIKSYSRDKRVYIEIEDDGIGIPPEDQERIFERFYRVDKARSRKLGGTGIGLSIVKNIILGHNGEVEVESEPGSGSVFRFWLQRAD